MEITVPQEKISKVCTADICVIGGSCTGVFAAVRAARLGAKVILVEQQNTARNGDIVVAMVDGFESEATVKTFYKEADHIRLQPENSSMSPIIVQDVKILGKVKGVFRYF